MIEFLLLLLISLVGGFSFYSHKNYSEEFGKVLDEHKRMQLQLQQLIPTLDSMSGRNRQEMQTRWNLVENNLEQRAISINERFLKLEENK